MAQKVKYFEDNVKYLEGPFVVCASGTLPGRVEVELVGHKCPVLPDVSIYNLLKRTQMNERPAEEQANWLNKQVKAGIITLAHDGWWEVAI